MANAKKYLDQDGLSSLVSAIKTYVGQQIGALDVGVTNLTTFTSNKYTFANQIQEIDGKISIAGTALELGFNYTASGKNYPVVLDSSKNAYVNVPWSNTDTWRALALNGITLVGSSTYSVLNFASSKGISITATASTGTFTFGHTNTATADSTTNLKSFSVDAYGHITAWTNCGTTSYTSSLTNSQYLGAKVTYDQIEGVRALVTGKTSNYVVSYLETLSSSDYQLYHKPDGSSFTSGSNLLEYVSGFTLVNASFYSTNDTISFGANTYFIVNKHGSASASASKYYVIYRSTEYASIFKVGDNFYILQTDVPDRWISAAYVSGTQNLIFSKLETQKGQNQTVLGSSVSFDASAAVNFIGSGSVTVSGCASNNTITINGTNTDTKNTVGIVNNTSNILYFVGASSYSTTVGSYAQSYTNYNIYAHGSSLKIDSAGSTEYAFAEINPYGMWIYSENTELQGPVSWGMTWDGIDPAFEWNDGEQNLLYYLPSDGGTLITDNSLGKLDTTATTAQSTATNESFAGTIKLHKVSKTGSYNDLLNRPTIPTVNNGKLTIQGSGSTAVDFTANQSTNVTLNIQGAGAATVSANATNKTITITSTDTDTKNTVGNYNATGTDTYYLIGTKSYSTNSTTSYAQSYANNRAFIENNALWIASSKYIYSKLSYGSLCIQDTSSGLTIYKNQIQFNDNNDYTKNGFYNADKIIRYSSQIDQYTINLPSSAGTIALVSQLPSVPVLGANRGLSIDASSYVGHSNSITSAATVAFKKVAYDAYGHLTSATAVAWSDITGLSGYVDNDHYCTLNSSGVLTTPNADTLTPITASEISALF